MAKYRVVATCYSPVQDGGLAARMITQEFAAHRLHHHNVHCSFSDGMFTLIAENDFDAKGLALLDEFADCMSAYTEGIYSDMKVKSVTSNEN